MKSKAAIGTHPIHPMIVPVPIGAFFLALVGDILHLSGRDPNWYHFSSFCIAIGIVTALLAAVALYAVSWWMRRNDAALGNGRFSLAMTLAVVAFLMLGVSGWLGGNLAYHHKVGVVEQKDPEATEIGMRESAS